MKGLQQGARPMDRKANDEGNVVYEGTQTRNLSKCALNGFRSSECGAASSSAFIVTSGRFPSVLTAWISSLPFLDS